MLFSHRGDLTNSKRYVLIVRQKPPIVRNPQPRARDPKDTRIRAIAITEAGLQKLIEAYPLWMAAQEEMANALGARQLKDFRASLDGSIESLSSYG